MQGHAEGLEEAHRRLALQRTPRFTRLDKLSRYVAGTQYEGKPDFLVPDRDVPLMERAPCIVVPVVETAIAQHIDFALGEGRFPTITTGASEDESDLGASGLTPRQSKVLDQFIRLLADDSRLRDAAQEALAQAECFGTACTIVCARNGAVRLESIDPKTATPTFSPDGSEVESLDIRVPYIDIYQGADHVLRARCLVYRRLVDTKRDVVYQPAEATHDGREPRWVEDDARSADHALGFCPVIWYRFRCGTARVGELDGKAIHTALLDELDALNFGLSQRHRAALYSGDPQLWETGVDKDEDVAPMGSTPRATVVAGHRIVDGQPVSFSRFGLSERPVSARRKGAGVVWRYQRAESKVGMLTLPGDALKGIDEHCSDLEDKLGRALAFTKVSPEAIKGALSGKALGFLYARTTSYVDRVRDDLWDGFLRPAVSMLLRFVHVIEGRAPGSINVGGAKKALPVVARFQRDTDGTGWIAPRMRPDWGRYFDQTADDELAEVNVAKVAHEAGLITLEMAVRKVARVFGIEDAAQVAEELEHEAEEAAAAALKATGEASEPGKPGGDRPGSEDEEDAKERDE